MDFNVYFPSPVLPPNTDTDSLTNPFVIQYIPLLDKTNSCVRTICCCCWFGEYDIAMKCLTPTLGCDSLYFLHRFLHNFPIFISNKTIGSCRTAEQRPLYQPDAKGYTFPVKVILVKLRRSFLMNKISYLKSKQPTCFYNTDEYNYVNDMYKLIYILVLFVSNGF